MGITYDDAKNAENIRKHEMSFELAADFEWASAVISEDSREDYGEPRYQALGLIHGRLCMLVFTPRDGDTRVISLRKANKREVRRYGK